jgi:hypothetical protein
VKQVLRCSVAWSVFSLLLLAGTSPLFAQQPSTPAASSDRVLAAVDVVLTHRVIEADGAPAASISTESAFTLQKLRTKSGATKIRLTYRRATPSSTSLRTPLEEARVEYDVASGETMVMDEGGRRVNPRLSMGPSAPTALGSFETWLQSLVFKSADSAGRRLALERTHGRPAGRVGRLTRYVQPRGDVSEELLVDPVSALPVEVKLLKQGVVEARTTIEYGAAPNGQLVRRRLQAEQLLEGGGGRRSVLSVDFSNVSVEGW